eukprot:COSAG05_NODE_1075_length_5956_cov_28.795629_3_plen_132_part_00
MRTQYVLHHGGSSNQLQQEIQQPKKIEAPRVGFVVKYLLGLMGWNLVFGFYAIIWEHLIDTVSTVCAGGSAEDAAKSSFWFMVVAAFLQGPEFYMYCWLLWVYFFEGWFLTWCFWCRLFCFKVRAFDEHDE